MTFSAFLYDFRHEDTPFGELARYVLADSRFPRRTAPTPDDASHIIVHLRDADLSEKARDSIRPALAAWREGERIRGDAP
jgi:hypothetical protein